MKQLTIATLSLCALLLGACGSGGPVRRVSEPSANIQQLSVRADGSWSVDLRIDNFSSIPMRFDGISLAMTVGGEQAGTLQGRPGLSIGPETADVATVALVPTAGAKIAIERGNTRPAMPPRSAAPCAPTWSCRRWATSCAVSM